MHPSSLAGVVDAVNATGLVVRGAFHCAPEDGLAAGAQGTPACLVLIGSVGSAGFDAFQASAEFGDGRADPLDRFSQRVIDELARRLGATALYPHRGPPWLPFQRWAARAEAVHPSPLGILIHPRHGLWHAYRGALLFPRRLAGVGTPRATAAPCAACPQQPCLHGCPVDAFAPGGFDAAACRRHLDSAAGGQCRECGCQARLACPVAPQLRYRGVQARFHMAAFAAGTVVAR